MKSEANHFHIITTELQPQNGSSVIPISKEALHILETADRIIYFPEKYFAGQRLLLIRDVNEIYEANSDLSTKQVVIQILSTLPDFLPPDNLVEVTRLIAEQWQKLTAEKQELVAA